MVFALFPKCFVSHLHGIFLADRRLVDMLSENEEVISFYPGTVKKDQVTLGRIVVHDRLKVEADILPRYFNHSSFASLRRQLNYFSFTRMGKGRQRGATYCNDAVVEMDDILRLKRRSTVGPNSPRHTTHHPSIKTGKRERSVSLISSSSAEHDADSPKHYPKKLRLMKHSPPSVVSLNSSPVHNISSDEEPQITLDLTVPSSLHELPPRQDICKPRLPYGDADILAGCKALLCFSKGIHFNGEIGSAV